MTWALQARQLPETVPGSTAGDSALSYHSCALQCPRQLLETGPCDHEIPAVHGVNGNGGPPWWYVPGRRSCLLENKTWSCWWRSPDQGAGAISGGDCRRTGGGGGGDTSDALGEDGSDLRTTPTSVNPTRVFVRSLMLR